jgi:hypothetical protein
MTVGGEQDLDLWPSFQPSPPLLRGQLHPIGFHFEVISGLLSISTRICTVVSAQFFSSTNSTSAFDFDKIGLFNAPKSGACMKPEMRDRFQLQNLA